jgi:hypothetical protein
MVFAMRLETDIAKHHDVVVAAGLLECPFEIFARIVVVAGEPFLEGAGYSGRCGPQTLAVRIIAGPLNERPYGGFRLRPRRFGGAPGTADTLAILCLRQRPILTS